MAKQAELLTTYLPKVLLLGINAPYNKLKDMDSYYNEFLSLVKTNGVTSHKTVFMKLREISSAYFFTKGKLEEVRLLCEKEKIEELIISETLTALQERNLSEILNVLVFDRTKLILEIFEKAAHSAEGKTQVALAMLQYKKTRLAGKGIHMSQQSGVVGVRGGFGETSKERTTRDIHNQILKLKKKLAQLSKTRENQRKNRLLSNVPHICLIGYTNSGKSTILNALTKSSVYAEDKLFATLDTTTRELYVKGKKKGVLSDSVGFIQNLPHNLIEAFKSTLDELRYADLLLHIVDLSSPNWELQIQVVHEILDELDIDKDMLYVFNKIDNVESIENIHTALQKYQPHVLTCAENKEGLQELKNFLHSWERSTEKKKSLGEVS